MQIQFPVGSKVTFRIGGGRGTATVKSINGDKRVLVTEKTKSVITRTVASLQAV